MQYRALYRETRPDVFSEVIGQDHIVKILRHQIATDSVNHAYLFCGTRGTGKTTTARILAKAVNCTGPDDQEKPCGVCDNCRAIAEGKFIDVIEIDAASNNGVDNVRELRESVSYPPAVGRKKVYIIDEVHMMSGAAFNALLKTLEEPPEHVMFILATTDPEKLPQTILSRCQRMDFRRVSAESLAENMKKIAEARGVSVTPDALRLLARNADGSVRDSLSLLEQCMASGEKELDREMVLEFLGAASVEFYVELTDRVMEEDIADAFVLLDEILREGKDVRQLMKDWMGHLRALMIAKCVDDPSDMLNVSRDHIRILKEQAAGIELSRLNAGIVTLAQAIRDARYSTQARILMEVAVVTIATGGVYGESGGAPAGTASPSGNVRLPSMGPLGDSRRKESRPGSSTREAGRPDAGRNVGNRAPVTEAAGEQPPIPEPPREQPGREEPPVPQPINGPAPEPDIPIPEPLSSPPPEPEEYGRPEMDAGPGRPEPQRGPAAEPERGPAPGQDSAGSEKSGASEPGAAAASSEGGAPQELDDPEQLDEIWNALIDELAVEKPSFMMIRGSTVLMAVGKTQFKVMVDPGFNRDFLESHSAMICRVMSERFSRPLRMVPVESGSEDNDEKYEELAEKATSILGVKTELK
ncbi:MAG: DNA polymerase III subunit gamma/tau [Anaerovoracaceae bacterium]